VLFEAASSSASPDIRLLTACWIFAPTTNCDTSYRASSCDNQL
jgi:hypothetical protein